MTEYYISLVKMVRSQQLQSLRAQSIQNPDNISFALLNNSCIWTERTESVKTESQVLAHRQRYLLELHHFICAMTVLSVWARAGTEPDKPKRTPKSCFKTWRDLLSFILQRATEDVKRYVFRRLAALWPGHIWISILPEMPDQNMKEEEQQTVLFI